MPSSAQVTFEPSTGKLDPIYPNNGARCVNVALASGVVAPGAPSLATASGTTLGVGVYKYQVTFVNAQGETNGGTEASVTTTTNNTNVSITAIPTGPTGVTARKIYRTAVGGATGSERLLTTIANNTATTFTDSASDASIAAAALVPTQNTAGITGTYVKGTILGELTATPGQFKAYASGNSDGSQIPKGILQYSCTVNPDGSIQLAGEFSQSQLGVPMYVGGGAVFDTTQLTGLDANAVTVMGAALIEGIISAGQLRF